MIAEAGDMFFIPQGWQFIFQLSFAMVFHLNKLESSSTNDGLCQVWLELAQWFWRRGFFNVVS